MSLNKFTNDLTGYNLKLHIGADTIKCNQLEVLSDIKTLSLDASGEVKADTINATTSVTINGSIVPETLFSDGFSNPTLTTGSGTLTNDKRVYTSHIVGNVRHSTLAGCVRYTGITGGIQGANKVCSVQIPTINGMSFPGVGEYITGSVSSQLNDVVVTGLYPSSCTATSGGNVIDMLVVSTLDFSGADPNRTLVIHFNFQYSGVIA